MRETSYTKTMKTACGKTISYFKEPGKTPKAHSIEGPAITYAEEEGLAPEYYLFGIKHKKADWEALINMHKDVVPSDINFDY